MRACMVSKEGQTMIGRPLCAIAFAPPSFFLTKSASAIQLATQVDAMLAVKVSRTMLNQFGPELA